MMPKDYYTVVQIADITGYSCDYIIKQIELGNISFYEVGNQYLIRKVELQRLLEKLKNNKVQIHTNDMKYFLFRPYKNKEGLIGRIIQISDNQIKFRVKNKEYDRQEFEKLDLEPLYEIKKQKRITVRGEFIVKDHESSNLFKWIDTLYKEVGYNNMSFKVDGTTIEVACKSTIIHKKQNIEWLESALIAGEFKQSEKFLNLMSQLRKADLHLTNKEKEQLLSEAQKYNVSPQKLVVQIILRYLNNRED